MPAAIAVKGDMVGEARSADGGVAFRIRSMTVVAAAGIAEYASPACHRVTVRGQALQASQVLDHIVDGTRRQGTYVGVRRAGLRPAKRRHVSKIPRFGIIGANAVADDSLYVSHGAFAIQPIRIRQVGYAQRRRATA